MRWGFFLAAVFLLAAPWAHAQVSVNMNALNGLAPTPAAGPSPPATGVPAPAPVPHAATPMRTVTGKLPLPPVPPGPPPAAFATLGQTTIGPLPSPPPKHPPANPVIAPIVLVGPPHPETMPPPPHVVDGAPGSAMRIPDGLRVTFGADGAALNPATLAALREIAGSAADEHAPSVSVDGYAKSDPSDPSTARRLSLSRALAAQAVLREAGIPSERIYVRALLAEDGTPPANRVDVTFQPEATPKAPPPKGSP
jgi:hypothetical protein